MRRLLLGVIFCISLTLAFAEDAKPKPKNLTMTLAWVADAGEPKQYVFVINGVVAYKTIEGLKKHLKGLPKGSTLTCSPDCCRIGNESLGGSLEEMENFTEFCELIGVRFILVPSG
ncbi:MAG: hypothetical protein GX811_06790 [Lentisphaerae bacterium]|jgi:hypothetical protein|nr:hypothetical protein [Lentisphaerota bacterium]